MSDFKPLLASPADLNNIRYTVLGSPKLDGIRAIVRHGVVLSKKLLPIPNKQIQQMFGRHKFEGLDGELIVGAPTDEGVYHRTNSFVMSRGKVDADFKFWAFDFCHEDNSYARYENRYDAICGIVESIKLDRLVALPQTRIPNRAMLDAFEEECVEAGFEGIMLRDPGGIYKFGRSTAKEGILLKVKRFEDSEAVIIGVEEEMANTNEALRDNLGRTKRSTAKAGKVGKGTMGALIVRDLKTKVEFNIGGGFTAAQRAETWKIGDIVKYKFFPVGVKDKPRHPVFIGRRDKIDL